MVCPICEKRKAKRFCPAKGQTICSVCCGTEREVTIDCPSDCAYLIASRQYDWERQKIDRSKIPFPETKIPVSFAEDHGPLLAALNYAICVFARDHRPLVDADVLSSLQALAESYRTLESGLYYEKPPDYVVQRELYQALTTTLGDFKKRETERTGMSSTRDGDIRNALVFLAQLGATRANDRPKGRAYLDLLRSQFPAEEFSKPESRIVLP